MLNGLQNKKSALGNSCATGETFSYFRCYVWQAFGQLDKWYSACFFIVPAGKRRHADLNLVP